MGQHNHLYNARWRRERLAFLAAHPLCRMHEELGRVQLATVVDHKIPHRGDETLFWDRGNWQPLCKPCHDAHKQAQEHSPDGLLRGAGVSGVPLDRAHPWHRPVQGGGGEISRASAPNTGLHPSVATPRNGQGGLSR